MSIFELWDNGLDILLILNDERYTSIVQSSNCLSLSSLKFVHKYLEITSLCMPVNNTKRVEMIKSLAS